MRRSAGPGADEQKNVGGVPITDSSGKLVGILTRRDLRFLESKHPIRR